MIFNGFETRCNTKVKIYPDGMFISCTANRPFFLTPEQRLRIKERKLLEKEEVAERIRKFSDSYAVLHTTLYEGGRFRLEYLASVDFSSVPDDSYSEIAESMFLKAKRLGIPLNGVVYLDESGSAPRPDNVRRAKSAVFDLIALNDFPYFATFTFNPRKTDSFSVSEVMQKVIGWLKNHQKRNALRYVLVPEYHKSGRIHLHMLYDGNLKLKDSGKRTKQGKVIYNCKSWRYGFSTVIPTDGDRYTLAKYVTKYVTKDVQKIFGKYYYSSQGLQRTCPVEYCDRVYSEIDAVPVYVPCIDTRFKYQSSFQQALKNGDEILEELELITHATERN